MPLKKIHSPMGGESQKNENCLTTTTNNKQQQQKKPGNNTS